jgi:hypothetical protein
LKHPTKQFDSLESALKALEPCVRDPRHLRTGKPLKKFGGMLPRELLSNWLLCAVLNEADGPPLMVATDPVGGDGLIVDTTTNEAEVKTEHVMVRSRDGRSEADLKTLILGRVEKKRANGEAYASGKTLVVFLDEDVGGRVWFPNEVARGLPDPLYFNAVWVVGLEPMEAGEYVYTVVHLDVSDGDALVVRVRIAKDFASWTVRRVQ